MPSQPHIMLIDTAESRDVLAERLRMQGYAVTVTGDAAQGAMLALAEPPAAVVADLWMPTISGVQLCRLLRAEPATQSVPVILRGPEQDQRSRFWAERAGAASYVGRGRMGDLVRALSRTVKESEERDGFFVQLHGENDIRDRIAGHLDTALFESVLASEVRALGTCVTFSRLFDLLSQFVSRVASYRWLALRTVYPERLAVHVHPAARERARAEVRAAFAIGEAPILWVEDEDAYEDEEGPEPLVREVTLGTERLGSIALALRTVGQGDGELLSVVARELGGPVQIANLMEESQRMATTDALTGLMNRRTLMAALGPEMGRSDRFGIRVCVVLLDVDHFKKINDRRGHQAGDAVLAALGRLLSTQLRKVDLAGRLGGEEFVVILCGADVDGGRVAAERLRQAIAALEVRDKEGKLIPVTASLGLALYEPGDDPDTLVDRADRAMYAAKMGGRNRAAYLARGAKDCELIPHESEREASAGEATAGGEQQAAASGEAAAGGEQQGEASGAAAGAEDSPAPAEGPPLGLEPLPALGLEPPPALVLERLPLL